ncbi:MAG TPA: aminotransferase class III-fold pyridoxal phosphate-dependent enzyme, partial [Thermoanaerobaculia bacterium]|nr:aminotransferase class III-fold pyridoxal phosphate-dependent enzyme [Thermoanaerobaculia bacterium]
MSERSNNRGAELYQRAKRLIPGGTQLLSKRPEMFLPEQWPAYYRSAKGCRVTDLDGRTYLDFSHCGVGTCVLGYADPDVDAAVKAAIDRGSMSTLNDPAEVELAELLIELHPWAEMARYARTGGEAMAIAARIARAATGRSTIAFCGYHGWADWYLAANVEAGDNLAEHLLPGLAPRGVPPALEGTILPFRYNRLDDLEEVVAAAGGDLAAVVMEPQRSAGPEPGFLAGVARLCRDAGAVLVFDEVTSGFRMTTGGLHLALGVEPDVAVFAKGMSNGYPMAAVIGRRPVMEAAQGTFISSTYWTESIGPAAALATIAKHRDADVPRHLVAVGERLTAGWREAAAAAGLEIAFDGIPPLAGFSFPGDEAPALTTLFIQQMLRRGFLASTHVYAMLAHRDDDVSAYLEAVGEAF